MSTRVADERGPWFSARWHSMVLGDLAAVIEAAHPGRGARRGLYDSARWRRRGRGGSTPLSAQPLSPLFHSRAALVAIFVAARPMCVLPPRCANPTRIRPMPRIVSATRSQVLACASREKKSPICARPGMV